MKYFALRKTSATALAFAFAACITLPAFAADRKIERRVPPNYPELAKRMRIGGTVRVAVTVAADGSVTEAKTVSGNRILAPAAEEAIKKWKFAPGDAVSTENIDVDFEVND